MKATEPILGIDLGTTNSLVAIATEGRPRVLTDDHQQWLVPSVISLDGHRFVVGQRAKDRALDHPEHTIYSVKRLMGRALDEISEDERKLLPFAVVGSDRGLAQIQVDEKTLTPEEVSAMVLRELKERARQHLGQEINKAVITVPAYFDDAQRQATRLAGKLAGLEVLRIVNEPTAAALAYGLDRTKSGVVVVYDLGGGTFDVSVLDIRDGIFRVRSTAGNSQLGGDDFDRCLMEHLLKELPDHIEPDARLLQAIKQAAEKTKIQLSTHDQVTYSVRDDRYDLNFETTVTRAQFEAWIGPLVEETLQCCQQALVDAETGTEELKAVVMVGGSTRVPLVQAKVEEFFQKKPYTGLDPDQVVALGASVQAEILGGGSRDLLLLDVIPLSLGIETYGGGVAKIIMRNSPIPVQASDTFTTQVDQQTGIDIHILQGERELVADCRGLGRFSLRGLPPLAAGMVRVEVTFLVDENGVLTVKAVEQNTRIEASIEVVPSHGLTDQEIAKAVEESVKFARSDFQSHQLIDLRNELTTMVAATKKVLAQNRHSLRDSERKAIEEVLAEVSNSMDLEDVRAVKSLYDRFVEVTVPLAGEVMSDVAKQAIRGRTIDQVLADEEQTPQVHEEVSAGSAASPKVDQADKDCGDLGDGFRAANPAAPKSGDES